MGLTLLQAFAILLPTWAISGSSLMVGLGYLRLDPEERRRVNYHFGHPVRYTSSYLRGVKTTDELRGEGQVRFKVYNNGNIRYVLTR